MMKELHISHKIGVQNIKMTRLKVNKENVYVYLRSKGITFQSIFWLKASKFTLHNSFFYINSMTKEKIFLKKVNLSNDFVTLFC